MSIEVPDRGEIEVEWVRTPDGSTKVTARLGNATVTAEHSGLDHSSLPWLVQSMGDVMNAAWDQIESNKQGDQ